MDCDLQGSSTADVEQSICCCLQRASIPESARRLVGVICIRQKQIALQACKHYVLVK